MQGGKKIWYFADGFLPEPSREGKMEAHEALMLFNTHKEEVNCLLDIYFSDREPQKDIRITIAGERIISLRMDKKEDLAGFQIPLQTQYALRIRAEKPIVVQFGRLDTAQSNMSYYLGTPFCEED